MGIENDITPIRPKVTGYVQASAGNVNYAGGSNVFDAGAKAGAQVKYKGLIFDVNAGAGTTLNAKAGLDFNIDLGKTMGLEVGASTRFDRDMTVTQTNVSYSTNIQQTINNDFGLSIETDEYNSYIFSPQEANIDLKLSGNVNRSIHKENLTSEIHAGLKFDSKKGNVSFGAIAANRHSLNKSTTISATNSGAINTTLYNNISFRYVPNTAENSYLKIQFDDSDLSCVSFNVEEEPDGSYIVNAVKEKNVQTTITEKRDFLFNKPNDEFAAGLYAKGELNLDKKGHWQAFGEISALKDIGAKGFDVQGNGGIRFKF